MTVQNSYVGGRWHQKWAHMSPQHFFLSGHGNWRKNDSFGKTLRTWKFLTENFSGPVTTESLRTQDSGNVVNNGWPSLRFKVTADESEVIGQQLVVLQKIRAVTDQSHSANFGPIALNRIEYGVPISEPMFYSFGNDRTKISGVTLIRHGLFTTRQM